MERPILSAMLSCQGLSLTDNEKYLFDKYNPLGISLFDRNLKNISQVKRLISEIKTSIGRDDVLIAIDQEGGRVSRLSNLKKNPRFVSEKHLGMVEAKYSKIHAKIISYYLRDLGINLNYAPVVDKIYPIQSNVLDTRCFSQRENKIISRANLMANTYIKQGICPCIKHIPGHFDAISDPHLGLSITNKSKEDIYKEISYLKSFANYPMAMTSHIILKNIDNKNPTSISKKIIKDVIREYIGFNGLLISDAIDMHALEGSIGDKARKSINAGCDVVCYCSGIYEEMQSICAEKIFMPEKTLIRFDKIKKIFNNKPRKENINILENDYLYKFNEYLDEQYSYDATEVLHYMQIKGENK